MIFETKDTEVKCNVKVSSFVTNRASVLQSEAALSLNMRLLLHIDTNVYDNEPSIAKPGCCCIFINLVKNITTGLLLLFHSVFKKRITVENVWVWGNKSVLLLPELMIHHWTLCSLVFDVLNYSLYFYKKVFNFREIETKVTLQIVLSKKGSNLWWSIPLYCLWGMLCIDSPLEDTCIRTLKFAKT